MKMSCNGCRVLRKGCGDDCSIRPCLQWIKSSESQANATVFLAKFYGRAGLINLINAGPDHLRPAIFRSMLYEACGRIVNPIYGSVGLLWSGSWHLCQAAVEAVLKGAPIAQISSDAAASAASPPLKPYDIRHVSKPPTAAADRLHKVSKPGRNCFKRPGTKPAAGRATPPPAPEFDRAGSHESAASRGAEPVRDEMESISSAGSYVSQAEPEGSEEGEDDVGLELTLGFGSTTTFESSVPSRAVSDTRFELGLALS